jgi:GNAT superfamily N-acetyltransferase
MFRDMGELPPGDVPVFTAAAAEHLRRALADGVYRGWLIESRGEVVAGAGVLVSAALPRPECPDGGEDAYVLNVYTEPSHRRRGLARMSMDAVLAWCRTRRIARVSLHASDDGRALYTSLGFGGTNEMRLVLRGDGN